MRRLRRSSEKVRQLLIATTSSIISSSPPTTAAHRFQVRGNTGPGKFKASTPTIPAQVLAPPPKADLIAQGRTVLRDNELFWNDVEVSDAHHGNLVVRGTVLYRLIV
jgi:hypothetical protein